MILDEAYCEFNTLDDPDASLDLLQAPPEPRAAADLLEGLRAVRAARRLRAVRLGRASVAAVDQVRQPFFCNALAQAAAIEALRHQDEVAQPRRAHGRRSALELEEELRELGLEPADVAGELLLVDLAR